MSYAHSFSDMPCHFIIRVISYSFSTPLNVHQCVSQFTCFW
jgi:hypothetical protein